MNIKSTVYWCVRGYTQLLAIVSLLSLILASIAPPSIDAPSPLNAPLAFLPFLLVSIMLLLPYGWSVQGPRYWFRLGLCSGAAIWLGYLAITDSWAFRSSHTDLLVSLALGLLAVSAPVSLVLHKRLYESSHGEIQ